jgi:hypothetical protein
MGGFSGRGWRPRLQFTMTSMTMLRGLTGGTAFSILDAPDLSKDTHLLERYDLDDVGEMVADWWTT